MSSHANMALTPPEIEQAMIDFMSRKARGAPQYRDLTSAGVLRAAARGRAVGGAPYGTRWRLSEWVDGPAVLEPVAAELDTLRRAVALREMLPTWDAVVAALSVEGRLTRNGKPWIRCHLASATRNPRVTPFLAEAASVRTR